MIADILHEQLYEAFELVKQKRQGTD